MRKVVVTGLGAISPLGVGIRRTWNRLLNGESGIVSTRSLGPDFGALPSQVAGLVPKGPKSEGKWTASEWITPTEQRQTATFAQYGLAAAAEALDDAGFSLPALNNDGNGNDSTSTDKHESISTKSNGRPDLDMFGVCLGSGIGNLSDLYSSSLAYFNDNSPNYRKIHPLFVPRILINLGAGHISMRYGLCGPNHAATTACTTGAHSIGDAMRFIQHGDADVMLAGGAESCIHPLALGGFARSRSLATNWNDDPEKASRPFDKDRAGFVIGEGAAVMVLEELEHAQRRKARIYAELCGYGCSADAYHLTAPRENGSGALLSMRKALRAASISPSEVDYVNAHATSTQLGDAAENAAIKSLLLASEQGAETAEVDKTKRGKREAKQINVSSTKGAIGHLLGAAGAIEAVFTVLAIHENIMPPTLNLENTSDAGEFDCNYVPRTAQSMSINVALTNSFGFGGTNATLCFRRIDG